MEWNNLRNIVGVQVNRGGGETDRRGRVVSWDWYRGGMSIFITRLRKGVEKANLWREAMKWGKKTYGGRGNNVESGQISMGEERGKMVIGYSMCCWKEEVKRYQQKVGGFARG